MVLVTGPTGSGKTVSLYTCLNMLNQPGVNISTVEDPAEINMPGVNQVNVNDKAGLNFAAALKSFLRQDPDIIMVGEIRDLETADIAIKAAQTGHMVLSTLHTNDAPTTLTRLQNMGVAPFNIASQHPADHRAAPGAPAVRDLQGAGRLSARGAAASAGFTEDDARRHLAARTARSAARIATTATSGRVGIYQVMPITEEMQQIILQQGNATDIAKQAPSATACATCAQSGLVKVKLGVTTLEEVISATNE